MWMLLVFISNLSVGTRYQYMLYKKFQIGTARICVDVAADTNNAQSQLSYDFLVKKCATNLSTTGLNVCLAYFINVMTLKKSQTES